MNKLKTEHNVLLAICFCSWERDEIYMYRTKLMSYQEHAAVARDSGIKFDSRKCTHYFVLVLLMLLNLSELVHVCYGVGENILYWRYLQE